MQIEPPLRRHELPGKQIEPSVRRCDLALERIESLVCRRELAVEPMNPPVSRRELTVEQMKAPVDRRAPTGRTIEQLVNRHALAVEQAQLGVALGELSRGQIQLPRKITVLWPIWYSWCLSALRRPAQSGQAIRSRSRP